MSIAHDSMQQNGTQRGELSSQYTPATEGSGKPRSALPSDQVTIVCWFVLPAAAGAVNFIIIFSKSGHTMECGSEGFVQFCYVVIIMPSRCFEQLSLQIVEFEVT